MQFKNPALLYALFLLLIPIFIHLFQLRRYKKVAFTNVAMLQQLENRSRNSQVLKKWLTLLSRLLALSAIIFAFAQPYFPGDLNLGEERHTAIYLDNSYSMELNGERGPLYRSAVNELIDLDLDPATTTVFTNDATYQDLGDVKQRNELLSGKLSAKQLTPGNAALRAQQLLQQAGATTSQIVLVSDFQRFENYTDSTGTIKYVRLQPQEVNNVSIDSVYARPAGADKLTITGILSGNAMGNLSVGLYNRELLFAKTAATLVDGTAEVSFSVPAREAFDGRLEIVDKGLGYDNQLYFTITPGKSVRVLTVSGVADTFLAALYSGDEFSLTQVDENQFNYNSLNTADALVLNELARYPDALIQRISQFKNQGGTVVLIPPARGSAGLDKMAAALGLPRFGASRDAEQSLTTINYGHPLLRTVFNKQVQNFQYPTIKQSYRLAGSDAVLRMQDDSPFVVTGNRTYALAAPLSLAGTNFKQSPLIVPLFYRMVTQGGSLDQLYYQIGQSSQVRIEAQMQPDEVIKLVGNDDFLIPEQQVGSTNVILSVGQNLKKPGSYGVQAGNKIVQNLAFNEPRTESVLTYANLDNAYDSLTEVVSATRQTDRIGFLWKWFLIAALVFLLIEQLLLKFLK